MSGLGSDLLLVLRRTARIVLGRWRLFCVFAGLLVAANLVQAAVGASGAGRVPALAFAMTSLFLVARLAVIVSLHIAGIRLAADPALPGRRVLALDARQALWFHGLVVIWIVGLGFKFGVGAPAMRLLTTRGVDALLADIMVTAAYLLTLFLLCVRIQPGVVGVMLGHPGVGLHWSIRAIGGHVLRTFAIAGLLGIPPLLLRQSLAHALAGHVLPAALADGILSAIMMLLPSVTYEHTYARMRAAA